MSRFPEAKGFIFDCDGTLLDSLGAWDEAERDLFAQAGPLTQEQEDEIHSAPIEKAAEIFHGRYGVGESPEAVLAHLDGYLLPFYAQRCEPMPGACAFVRMVHDQGIPCVVLSSSPRRYLDAGLRHAGIRDCFMELVTTDEVGVSKQEPEIYRKALDILGCEDVHEVFAVDDAPYAIAVMAKFGLRTIGVAAGCSDERRRALEEHADTVVETLCELLPS